MDPQNNPLVYIIGGGGIGIVLKFFLDMFRERNAIPDEWKKITDELYKMIAELRAQIDTNERQHDHECKQRDEQIAALNKKLVSTEEALRVERTARRRDKAESEIYHQMTKQALIDKDNKITVLKKEIADLRRHMRDMGIDTGPLKE